MASVRAVVTDIEGTTTSLSFVKDVLFPYAYDRLEPFLLKYHDRPVVAQQLKEVETIAGRDLNPAEAINVLKKWIEEDRKLTPLKTLQGLMWEEGYQSGDFRGHVYEDAAEVLKKWKSAGIALYVYSSGSVQAQKLLFSHTDYGDLSQYFSGFFDTRIGGKKEAGSYRVISDTIGQPSAGILFLSDVAEELAAAKDAGMNVIQLVRDDGITSGPYPTAKNFYQIDLSTL